jgi:hypothetical protein
LLTVACTGPSSSVGGPWGADVANAMADAQAQAAGAAPAVGVNRDIERAFLACPDHERIMTMQALATACTQWQRQLFLAVLEQSRSSNPHGEAGFEAVRAANDPGAPVLPPFPAWAHAYTDRP